MFFPDTIATAQIQCSRKRKKYTMPAAHNIHIIRRLGPKSTREPGQNYLLLLLFTAQKFKQIGLLIVALSLPKQMNKNLKTKQNNRNKPLPVLVPK
jgi:hypothetical protein